MRICLISTEIFNWGKYGGFGRATRIIGHELVKRGIEVFAIVPKRKSQNSIEYLDGIKVLSFSRFFPWKAKKLLQECDADIYHSCEPSHATYLAMKTMPHKKHMVTCRDPRDFTDWKMEFALPSLSRLQVIYNYFYENNILVRKCIRDMDAVFTTAKYLVPKVKSIYNPRVQPEFLPTPVAIPDKIEKASKPTACYLARLDRRKRPTLFLDLAEKFPGVRFITMGKSRDKNWEKRLRAKYAGIQNLEMVGFVDQFSSIDHAKLIEKSWVMISTAARESLPNAFLESAAQKCAILSHVDPNGFASLFGYHAKNDDFENGLRYLLENDRWKKRGERGYQYVKNTFELNRAIEKHIKIYENLISD